MANDDSGIDYKTVAVGGAVVAAAGLVYFFVTRKKPDAAGAHQQQQKQHQALPQCGPNTHLVTVDDAGHPVKPWCQPDAHYDASAASPCQGATSQLVPRGSPAGQEAANFACCPPGPAPAGDPWRLTDASCVEHGPTRWVGGKWVPAT